MAYVFPKLERSLDSQRKLDVFLFTLIEHRVNPSFKLRVVLMCQPEVTVFIKQAAVLLDKVLVVGGEAGLLVAVGPNYLF